MFPPKELNRLATNDFFHKPIIIYMDVLTLGVNILCMIHFLLLLGHSYIDRYVIILVRSLCSLYILYGIVVS